MNSLIVRDDSTLSIKFHPQAEELKAVALESSALIGIVRNREDQAACVDAQRMIRRLIKQVKESHDLIKAPVLEYGRTIDRLTNRFLEELDSEELRLATVAGNYQEEQLAIARKAEGERLLEIARIEEKKQEALRKAEAERQAELAKAKKSERAELLKKQEAERLADEEKQADISKQKIECLPPPVIPAKAKGQTVSERWLFDVTDIWLLCRMHPNLVRIEANRQEINEVISRGVREIKGLRIYRETKSSVRVGREPKALDV